MQKIKLAVVGATGLVGKAFLHILEEFKEDCFEIKLFASNKSKNKKIKIFNKNYVVHSLDENSFIDIDYACFFTPESVSKQYVPIALKNNVKVIDNSSAFRMNTNTKLIAYGANENIIDKNDKLISNPNCSTIQSIIPIYLLKQYDIEMIIYNTYQSVSGSGRKGIDDLLRCRKGMAPLFYETDISFTCIPKIGNIEQSKFSSEEEKMINESKKILDQDIFITATCVRVPTMFSHGVSVMVKLKKPFETEKIIKTLSQNSKIVICNEKTPNATMSCKNDKIYVGRIRKQNDVLLFYCVADNIRVGASTNAYYILKHLIKVGEKNED